MSLTVAVIVLATLAWRSSVYWASLCRDQKSCGPTGRAAGGRGISGGLANPSAEHRVRSPGCPGSGCAEAACGGPDTYRSLRGPYGAAQDAGAQCCHDIHTDAHTQHSPG